MISTLPINAETEAADNLPSHRALLTGQDDNKPKALLQDAEGADADKKASDEEKEMTERCDRKLEEQKEEEKRQLVEGSPKSSPVYYEDLADPKKGSAYAFG